MTTLFRSPRGARRTRLVLAGAFALLLLAAAASAQWTTPASLAAFAAAISVIAAAVIGWEHVVVDARNDGLIDFPDS
ncbi:hypothetical protein [Mycolicibacterium smegmatis]|jgi:hypothetical protein|uniref:Uncharacterized protein n=2 Tax=Mycolicibacterium smegmatis TaxID=1772 RepID=A0R350_MYCS2|nr:hypothetical protein [Mycolicibacterium smegmatis]ABK73449.1 hypothetical protein MSMEG_5344 [Mycolicibacterium smegmatis MC2 155]AIU10371.1 hypothetical protein LJ00_26415 [Mycolicibacterium smegmatis MC2 155]AIU16996.1 hypothetical protein LI99_26420 [Mycolicibacterium smegmatis]AIU23619.1 hypothetical protein LI98_26425 [Mycolicibacterium smegmatis]AWT56179.1 hypothetical protein D806_052290 [Mycolicibacterium smegmatis MKD8]